MSITPAPNLETERFILRSFNASDFEPIAAFFAIKERSWGFGGPKNRNDAWRWFAAAIGQWHLQGKGYWAIEDKTTGAALGMTGIWDPEGWPEPELGWVAFEGAEGKGVMAEAATAARLHAYTAWGMGPLCSLIFPGNTRSIRLAERLGATHERDVETPTHGREHLYRHPALQDLLVPASSEAVGH
ncbi:Protein export cytoplasm protein SecA ATPase RNA helicase [Candidatus Rhodobacter oscarellae]|uniref:Protein export cytoplasm protein SecA ATPase RNA helicase n=1 Tax=Candidatus Rhodobacter oscarellae TaxID=1675527 RepID=A0A0J9ECL6_9RHOB|nr:GNAT family N-acetyltransferase [Candidatus Rhodobacter lobularis]KMW60522.1 Protein export cytoplasm protein SecA ATPase RNA helicase [Candidatus Rhodobacter lobularis]